MASNGPTTRQNAYMSFSKWGVLQSRVAGPRARIPLGSRLEIRNLLQEPTPAQICQPILDISNNKGQVDGFVRELTFGISRQAVALDLDIQLAVEHLERPVEFWYPSLLLH